MSIDLQRIFDDYRRNLASVFMMIPGGKALVIERAVLSCLNRLCGMSFLKKYNVTGQPYFLDGLESLKKEMQNVVFMLPPDPDHVELLVKILKKDKDVTRQIMIVFSPMITPSAEYMLSASGCLGYRCRVTQLDMSWIAADEDILVTSWPNSLLLASGCLTPTVTTDTSGISALSTAMMGQLAAAGVGKASSSMSTNSSEFVTSSDPTATGNATWPHMFGQAVGQVLTQALDCPVSQCVVFGVGMATRCVVEGINHHCLQVGGAATVNSRGLFGGSTGAAAQPLLLIFCRDVDFVTPFLLPVTYEALLSEVMSREIDTVVFDKKMLEADEDRKLILNGVSPIYRAIRGLPISSVGERLNEFKRSTDQNATSTKNMGLHDLHEALMGGRVESLIQQRALLTCLFAGWNQILKDLTENERVDDLMKAQWDLVLGEDCEAALELAREYLAKGEEGLQMGLRLLCLASVVGDGLPDPVYEEFARLACQCAGYHAMHLLYELRRIRLFEPASNAKKTSVGAGTFAAASTQASLKGSSSTPSFGNILKRKVRSVKLDTVYSNLKVIPSASSATPTSAQSEPSYVFAQQFCPPVVRLVEELADYSIRSSLPSAAGGAAAAANNARWQKLDQALRQMSASTAGGLPSCTISLATGTVSARYQGGGPAPSVTTSSSGIVGPLLSLLPTGSSGETSAGSSSIQYRGRLVIIAMPGGCSYSELAALRCLAEKNHWRLLVLTSGLLTTKDLIIDVALG